MKIFQAYTESHIGLNRTYTLKFPIGSPRTKSLSPSIVFKPYFCLRCISKQIAFKLSFLGNESENNQNLEAIDLIYTIMS